MGALMLALTAATQLAPLIGQAIPLLSGALSPSQPTPLTTGSTARVFVILGQAAALVPSLLPLLPLVEKALGGTQFNDTDLATLSAAADAIDAAVDAKVSNLDVG